MSGWEWEIWTDTKNYRSRNGKYGPIRKIIGPETGNMDRYEKLSVQKREIWTDKKIYRSRNGKYGPIRKITGPETGNMNR